MGMVMGCHDFSSFTFVVLEYFFVLPPGLGIITSDSLQKLIQSACLFPSNMSALLAFFTSVMLIL